MEAARAAFPGWAGASPEVRADLLDKVGSLILERKEALGKLLASEEEEIEKSGEKKKQLADEHDLADAIRPDSETPGSLHGALAQ